jgi:hypothetical protein
MKMKTMKTTLFVSTLTMYFQIQSWNLKTSFYQLLGRPDPLLFLVKMTRSLSHLHIPFDATKLKFHPPKTGSISRASWTSTPTMILRVGPGGVSFKSLMPLDSHWQNPKKKTPVSYVQRHPILHFLCLYFNCTQFANLHPLTRHTNNSSCTISVPLIAWHDSRHPHPSTSISTLIIYIFSFLSQSCSEQYVQRTLAIQKQMLHTTLNYYYNLFNNLFFLLSPCDKYYKSNLFIVNAQLLPS